MLAEKRVDGIGFEASKSAFVATEVIGNIRLYLLGNEVDAFFCCGDFLLCDVVFVYAESREGDIGVGHGDRVARMASPTTVLDVR